MSKRVVFHIGPPKTGSSAIQHFLHQHRTELASLGILYPNHTIDENGISSGNARVVCVSDDKGRLVFDPKKLTRTLDAFQKASEYHTLLLSSESFFRIADDVIAQVPNAEIVCFIRNPVEFQLSIYNQSVKRHGNHASFIAKTRLNLGQWDKLLALREHLTPESFHCFAYKSPDDQGSIIGDLLRVLQVDDHIPISTTSVNVSYSFAALELKRSLNQFPIASLQNELDTYLQATSQHGKRYRLIDDEALMACQQQLEAAMERFRSLLPETEWKHISQAQAQLAALPFVNQADSQGKVADLVMQLRKERPSLYRALANILGNRKGGQASETLLSLFRVSKAAQLAGRISLWQHGLLDYLKKRINNRQQPVANTTAPFGAIRCGNVDIITQDKDSSPNRVKGGLRGDNIPDFAQQYRCHPSYVKDDSPFSATDVAYLTTYKTPLTRKKETYYYGGPLFNNFGHFLAENVHRLGGLQAARQADNGCKVVFLPQRYKFNKGKFAPVLPAHFYAVLAYLGVPKKDILLPKKSFTADTIWVSPQQSIFRSRTPVSDAYRQFLVHRERAAGITPDLNKPKKIYVSRTDFALKGAFAGESVLEAHLEKQGFYILKPETLSLQEQLSYYKSADILVFAEGAALHVLELLGEIPGKVVIIQRRKHAQKIFIPLLQKRSKEVVSFSELYELPSLFLQTPSNKPAHGSVLSVLDSRALSAFLEQHIQCQPFDQDRFTSQVKADIQHYYQTYSARVTAINPALLSRFKDNVTKLVTEGIVDTDPEY
ncbi:glycosyltransferase family 61 protein [Alteromonas sp. 14N.309.X.WAT.G.H12]|uniref:glycosyltransferase family 61 protein n=1 Tax=Alteromonas sp. 14N.309.X.WAT.G.H12 TaxID=3120824 RepID=UPI002FD1882F